MNRANLENRFGQSPWSPTPPWRSPASRNFSANDLDLLISELFQELEGAYAPATLSSYRSDFECFRRWCMSSGHDSLPANPGAIADFIAAETERISPATVRRRVSAISTLHVLAEVPDPTKSRAVRLALRRMFRLKGRRQSQALGLTADLRDKLLAATTNDLIGLRDRALVSIAYDTLRRRSELVALRIDDLQPVDEGGAIILVRHSKSDQEGEGKYAYVAPQSLDHCRQWIQEAELDRGHLLRAVDRHGRVGETLYPGSVGRVYKKLARNAGLPDETVRRLSGHSARVGAAQDMAAAGIDIIAIMQAGGWRTPDIVGRYIENLDVMRGGRYRLEVYQQERDSRNGRRL